MRLLKGELCITVCLSYKKVVRNPPRTMGPPGSTHLNAIHRKLTSALFVRERCKGIKLGVIRGANSSELGTRFQL